MINTNNKILLEHTFENTPSTFNKVLNKILDISNNVTFGLEDTHSFGKLFTMFLQNKGYTVKHVYASLASIVRTSRPNYHKTDEFDAYCVAHILKDMHNTLPSPIFNENIDNLKLLLSRREILIKSKNVNYTFLHSKLVYNYPNYNKFFCELQTKSAKYFFKKYPHPSMIINIDDNVLLSDLKTINKATSIKKVKLIKSLIDNEIMTRNDKIVNFVIKSLISEIEKQEKDLYNIEKKLDVLLNKLPYKLTTIPGVNTVTACKIISEVGDIKRFKNEKGLARYSGVAPVTISSSTSCNIKCSKGGNRTLRATLYFLSISMITVSKNGTNRSDLFRNYFDKKVNSGKSKPQALICIMRQLVRIIFYMMKNETEFRIPKELDNK